MKRANISTLAMGFLVAAAASVHAGVELTMQSIWDHADADMVRGGLMLAAEGSLVIGVEREEGSERVVVNGREQPAFDSISQQMHFSRDRRHYAYFGKRAGKWFVCLDGQEAGPYEWLDEETFGFTNQRLFYIARRGAKPMLAIDLKEGQEYDGFGKSSPAISADGAHVGLVTHSAGKWRCVIDGIAGSEYGAIGAEGISFSPDGARSVYMAQRGAKWVLVINGVEADEFDSYDGAPSFSPDGKHLALAALIRPGWHAVVDGQRSPAFEGVDRPVIAGDPIRSAFVAWRGAYRNVVVDGAEQERQFEHIQDLAFSPDGAHLMYQGRRGNKWTVVIDGNESDPYEVISDLRFTKGGHHIVYQATNLKPVEQRFVVIDGVASGPYDLIDSVVTSDDGGHVAFVGRTGAGNVLVVDGAPGKAYPMLSEPLFSSDGKRVACVMTELGADRLLLDGQLGEGFATIGAVRFTPDSAHVVYWAQQKGGSERWCVVVDEKVSGEFMGAATGFWFDSPTTFSTIGFMNSSGSGLELYRVTGRIGGTVQR